MVSLTSIRRGKGGGLRQVWIKRRLAGPVTYTAAGDPYLAHEADWVRVDNWGGVNRMIGWPTVSTGIDTSPDQPGTYDARSITLELSNADRAFTGARDYGSIWRDYSPPRFTLVTIRCQPGGYGASGLTFGTGVWGSGAWGVGVWGGSAGGRIPSGEVFLGYIDTVSAGADDVAEIEVLPITAAYKTVVFDAAALGLGATATASAIIAAIISDSRLAHFGLTSGGVVLDHDPTITTANLSGDCLDVLTTLAWVGGSVVTVLAGSMATVAVVTRTRTASALDIKKTDVYDFNDFDGDGAAWIYTEVTDGTLTETTTNPAMLATYRDKKASVDLSLLDAGTRAAALSAILSRHSTGRKSIEIDVRFMFDRITAGDAFAVDFTRKSTATWRWGCGGSYTQLAAAGEVWGRSVGVRVPRNLLFIAARVDHDLASWRTKIYGEEAKT